MSINRGRTTTTEGAHASLVRILSILLFLSWWRALKRRFNHPETVWIPLEARHLNRFKNSFKETCKYVFSYILDDRIIYSWGFNVLNIRFNFAAFDVLIKNLESYRPQIPSVASEPSFTCRELSNEPKKHLKGMRNEGDMVIWRWIIRRRKKKFVFFLHVGTPSPLFWGPGQPPPLVGCLPPCFSLLPLSPPLSLSPPTCNVGERKMNPPPPPPENFSHVRPEGGGGGGRSRSIKKDRSQPITINHGWSWPIDGDRSTEIDWWWLIEIDRDRSDQNFIFEKFQKILEKSRKIEKLI